LTDYVIKNGDTLSDIANQFNTTIDYLVNVNNITNRNLIYVGQVLKVPMFIPPLVDYVIQNGDNLTSIATTFHTTVDYLVKINNIANPNLIYVGKSIKVPKR
jgi:lysozyme